jgi:hypothetical protein
MRHDDDTVADLEARGLRGVADDADRLVAELAGALARASELTLRAHRRDQHLDLDDVAGRLGIRARRGVTCAWRGPKVSTLRIFVTPTWKNDRDDAGEPSP